MSSTNQMLTAQLDAQIEEFNEIYNSDDPFEQLYSAPLEVCVRRRLVAVLSTGGPHVEAVAELGDNGTVVARRVV